MTAAPAAPPATGLQQCHIHLPPSLVAWLDQQAADACLSRSAFVRQLIAREMRAASHAAA